MIKSTNRKSSFSKWSIALSLSLLMFFHLPLNAQINAADVIDIDDDDLSIGSDIFSDYNEDIEATQVLEDERFFRYGRFFTFAISVGNTTFTGNRGSITQNEPPSWGMSVSYFLNFRVSYQLGIEFSKHNMLFNGATKTYANLAPGLVEVNMLRPYFGIKYHVDTADLGTALTYSNPYLIARLEYWIQKNKFIDQPVIPDQSGGGIGLGIGAGLEFPIVLKEYYVGVELLYHTVNYFDKFSQDYRECSESGCTPNTIESIDDLTGNALSLFVSYILTW